MKKVRFLILILLLILSFSACSSTQSTTEIPTTVPTTLVEDTLVAEEPATIVADTTIPATTQLLTDFAATTESTTAPTTEQATTQEITSAPTTQAPTTQPTTVATTAEPTEPTTIPPTTQQTTQPTTTQPTTIAQTTQMQNYCIVRIECHTIYDNLGKLKDSKKSFLPSNGVILDNVQVALEGGESVFDVIKKACAENVCTDHCSYCQSGGVQLEYTYTPAFNNYYIEGIHQIYEKDCGTQSGWMYSVNGVFPDVGTSSYAVSQGDVIVFSFTCNMGEDIGNSY